MLKTGISSEVGNLKTVLIHEPGAEVENVTPETAERALYSDILNLPIAKREYKDFENVLEKVSKVVRLKELLAKALENSDAKDELIKVVVGGGQKYEIVKELSNLENLELINALIEGVKYPQVTLANFLRNDRLAINPLHNLFFMRDASFAIGNNIFVSSMAKGVRRSESKILEVLFKYVLDEGCGVININSDKTKKVTIEGGDVLVVSPEMLIVGIGSRTSPEAVDRLIEKVSEHQGLKYVLVQELPERPESFIHLDMIFTLLSENECMIYKPVILDDVHFRTVLMKVDNGKVVGIDYVHDLIEGLNFCGKSFEPVFCGGGDSLLQEREQWHSGANFFSFAPGKIIGYSRNNHTSEALSKRGYEILKACDVVGGKVNIENYKKCLVTIEGSELARGGGGARCMTMPILRE